MEPVVTASQARAADASAGVGEDVLIERAGWSVAREARQLLGGTYGRRVVVVAGTGNNGNDGRFAARCLARRGAKVVVIDPAEAASMVFRRGTADLVIDAAFGTGFRGTYRAPLVDGVPVLAVDIPSGVIAATGRADEGAVRADRTVTFAAYKPGLLLAPGVERAGEVRLIDIGLTLPEVTMGLVGADDVRDAYGAVPRESHKWRAAVLAVAGSPGMQGAALLVAQGASRAGAGMVRLGSPGVAADRLPASEAVAIDFSGPLWCDAALEQAERVHAAVVGPGLGRSRQAVDGARELLAKLAAPVVVDGDGLFAVTERLDLLVARAAPTVLTPHDGELVRLLGRPLGEDRVADVQELAHRTAAVVLSKGSTTVVAAPDGRVRFVTTGDARLATAGTGDVLSGMVGAALARGMDPLVAASVAAYLHGAAARQGALIGLVAGDLPPLVARTLSRIVEKGRLNEVGES